MQTSVLKAQKHEAERLVKQAKTLLAKHPANDREKAANLDAALQMARRADSLHGGYSVWEFGDRPDKMVKDIEAARAKMKLPPAPVQNKVVTAMGTQKPARTERRRPGRRLENSRCQGSGHARRQLFQLHQDADADGQHRR